VKNKGQKSPSDVEPVSVAIKAAGADVILEWPAAIRNFGPNRTPI
jgi:hypothetical protein